jgi:hypothetical protein
LARKAQQVHKAPPVHKVPKASSLDPLALLALKAQQVYKGSKDLLVLLESQVHKVPKASSLDPLAQQVHKAPPVHRVLRVLLA